MPSVESGSTRSPGSCLRPGSPPAAASRIAAGLLASPEAVRRLVRDYAESGCDHLVLFPTVPRVDQVERLADVV